MQNSLSQRERNELYQCEQSITRGLVLMAELGAALLFIRDEQLYRDRYSSFAEYCRKQWGIVKSLLRAFIEAMEAARSVLPDSGVEPAQEALLKPLAQMPIKQQQRIWQTINEGPRQAPVAAEHVRQVTDEIITTELAKAIAEPLASHQLIIASQSNEWYTPKKYVDAAREVMGDIDLDPASNEFANQIVQAKSFYSAERDGLKQEWQGRVWLNPPYGKQAGESSQAIWTDRLMSEHQKGNVAEAILLVNAAIGNSWFTPLKDFPICFPDSRINFYRREADVGHATHGSALVYFGTQADKFVRVFSRFGAVMMRVIENAGQVTLASKNSYAR